MSCEKSLFFSATSSSILPQQEGEVNESCAYFEKNMSIKAHTGANKPYGSEDRGEICENVIVLADGHSGSEASDFYVKKSVEILKANPKMDLRDLTNHIDTLFQKTGNSSGCTFTIVRTVFYDESRTNGHFEILWVGDSRGTIFSKYNGETNVVYETEIQDADNPRIRYELEKKGVEFYCDRNSLFKFISREKIEDLKRMNNLYDYVKYTELYKGEIKSPVILHDHTAIRRYRISGGLQCMCKGHADGRYDPCISEHSYEVVPFTRREGEEFFINVVSDGVGDVLQTVEIAEMINASDKTVDEMNSIIMQESINRWTKPVKLVFRHGTKLFVCDQALDAGNCDDITSIFVKV